MKNTDSFYVIYKKEWLRAKDENIVTQKEQAAAECLLKLQKSAMTQIDERVDARIADKMESTVVDTVQNILVDNLNSKAFKDNGARKHKKKHGSGLGDKKHKSGQNSINNQQTLGNKPTAISVTSTPLTTVNTSLPSQFVQTTQGHTNNQQNIQYVAVPVDQVPQFSFNDFRAGRSIHTGPIRGTLISGSRRGRRGSGFTRF